MFDDDEDCLDKTGGRILRGMEPVDGGHHAGEVNMAVEHCLRMLMVVMVMVMVMVRFL